MIYGAGAAAGFSPRQMDKMTLWEFTAAFDGWATANGAKKAKGAGGHGDVSDERLKAMGIRGFT